MASWLIPCWFNDFGPCLPFPSIQDTRELSRPSMAGPLQTHQGETTMYRIALTALLLLPLGWAAADDKPKSKDEPGNAAEAFKNLFDEVSSVARNGKLDTKMSREYAAKFLAFAE